MAEPYCFRCGRTPEQIGEYVTGAREHNEDLPDDQVTPTEWVRRFEGTYNPESNRFCCTECYLAIGMPATDVKEGGWRAP